MLYLLSDFSGQFNVLNVFRYLTFRAGGAVITALLVAFFFGPAIIRWLRTKQKFGQPIRTDGPQSHLVKQGTPTMGGVMMLLGIGVATLLWADLSNKYVWITMFVTMGYGFIGFLDDYLKVTKRSVGGLKGKLKLVAEVAVAGIAAYLISVAAVPSLSDKLALPFVKEALIDLGIFYIPVAIFVVVGAANSVNLWDGLDGLAMVPVMLASGVFVFIG
jgi:phospho-N-acetylmuramoyl-pentapeptide-transferase